VKLLVRAVGKLRDRRLESLCEEYCSACAVTCR
jgi:hypothetical protein